MELNVNSAELFLARRLLLVWIGLPMVLQLVDNCRSITYSVVNDCLHRHGHSIFGQDLEYSKCL
jgi:hypothetical protein